MSTAEKTVGFIGAGNMATALIKGIITSGTYSPNMIKAYDNDPEKIGEMTRSGLRIKDIADLEASVKELNIEIGVISTPPSAAQKVADLFLKAKVYAILNFSPTRIQVPDCCLVENIDFTVKLDILTYRSQHEIGL